MQQMEGRSNETIQKLKRTVFMSKDVQDCDKQGTAMNKKTQPDVRKVNFF